MPISLAGIGYPVRDLAQARTFYEALFDTTAARANDVEVCFEIGGIAFQLAIDLRASPPPKEGVLLTWHVDDLDRAVAAAERNGGRCVLRRAPGEHGSLVHAATVTDGFGNYIALKGSAS